METINNVTYRVHHKLNLDLCERRKEPAHLVFRGEKELLQKGPPRRMQQALTEHGDEHQHIVIEDRMIPRPDLRGAVPEMLSSALSQQLIARPRPHQLLEELYPIR